MTTTSSSRGDVFVTIVSRIKQCALYLFPTTMAREERLSLCSKA
jgi:hypothetical protein